MSGYLTRFGRRVLWAGLAVGLVGCGQDVPDTAPALDAMAKTTAPSLPAVFHGRDIEAWLRAIGSLDAYERQSVAWAVAELGHGAATSEVDAALVRLVRDDDAGVQRAAMHAMDRLGRVPDGAWPSVVAAEARPPERPFARNAMVRQASDLLRTLGPVPLAALEDAISGDDVPPGVLVAYSKHEAREPRRIPLERLRGLADGVKGLDASAALQLLSEHGRGGQAHVHQVMLGAKDASMRTRAAAALGHAKALDLLRASLRHESSSVRYDAAMGLSVMGPAAAPAASDLLRIVAQEGRGAPRQGAIEALIAIGKPARPAIIKWITEQPDGPDGKRLRTIGQMMLIRIGD